MLVIRKVIIWALIVLGLYTLAGFFVLPPILKSVLVKNLSESLGREVSIEKIRTNPFSLSLKVTGVSIRDLDKSEELASFDMLFLNLQSVSIFKRAVIIRELQTQNPYLRIVHLDKNRFNFSDLIKKDSADAKKPIRFSVENIQVFGGRISVADKPKDTVHKVTDINLSVPFISNISYFTDIFVQPSFEAIINETPVSLKGQTKPFADSLETVFNITLNDIDLPFYLAYLPQELDIKVPAGILDIKTTLSYIQYNDKQPDLVISGRFDLKNLEIVDGQDQPLLNLALLSIDLAPSHLLNKEIHLTKTTLTSPQIYLERDKAGKLNYSLIRQKTSSPADTSQKEMESTPVTLTIDTLDFQDGTIMFSDESLQDPVDLVLDKVMLQAQDISTREQTMASFDCGCTMNKTGLVSAQGSAGINPIAGNISFDLQKLSPGWVQPYFTNRVRIIISKGTLGANGSVTFSKNEKGGLQTVLKGNASLSDFASVDKENAEDFLKLKNLNLDQLEFGLNPGYISIKEVALNGLDARVILNPDGKLNLQKIIHEKESTNTAEQKKDTPTFAKIKIDKVSLKNSHINFTDRSIEPYYTADLEEIEGSVSGLTSEENKKAEVLLSGKLDHHAPLSISGSINPLRKDLFVELKASFNDIELTPVSPYSGKYIGYAIQKGKLSMDMDYLIDKKVLDAQNNIFIDQFTFGNAVDSPEALKLPVKLAVALLKDPQGRIKLKLPVTGRTDDPDFHVGKIVFKIITNIIKKAAASPFSLLEAMYPGAKGLQYVEFDYGKSHLPVGCESKIQTLVQILSDRPTLSLELTGYVDPEMDRQGLIDYLFEKKVKAQKLKDMLKKGQPSVAVDMVTLESDEYEFYLKKAYKNEKFQKPKNVLGFDKSLPPPEMQRLILEHIEINDNDLRDLAIARMQQVKDCLVGSGTIEAQRIFMVEADTFNPESIQDTKNSRVSLAIR